MRRRALLIFCTLLLCGCRDVRVQTYVQNTTNVNGPTEVRLIRSERTLGSFGVDERDVDIRFNKEFGVILLMGPHERTGYRQIIESIKADPDRVRIVAFEREPGDGGEPVRSYRTYTLWIVPNSVYRRGSRVEVVTPDGSPIANAVLK